ncbi:YdcF family protein [Mucilaginibacter paludis]|nr:YdcF family protein [Mucilaginibacter paludis]
MWDITQGPPPEGKYSCAIVLGGFSSADQDGNGYFNGSADRFIKTLQLKVTGRVPLILMSGGNGQLIKTSNLKEADYVFSQFKAFNIPDSCIMIENQSRNTLENAMFTKRILIDKKVPGPYLLVTSAFHMRRSAYIFKKIGINVTPYPCDFIAGKSAVSLSDFIIPDPLALAQWNIYIKEVVGFVAYYLKPVPAINAPGQL